jgi:prepilin-type N-terminal cleavage/methylation domain-containing protein
MTLSTRKNDVGAAERGFTLVEMTVVLFLVGLMMFVAMPYMDFGFPKYRMRANGREMASMYEVARADAAGTGLVHYIQYDFREGEYRMLAPVISNRNDEGVVPEGQEPLYKWEVIRERELGEGVEFKDVIVGANRKKTSGVVTLKVNPFGLNVPHTIHLKNSDKDEMTIVINGLTGRPTFHNEYVEPPEVEVDEE